VKLAGIFDKTQFAEVIHVISAKIFRLISGTAVSDAERRYHDFARPSNWHGSSSTRDCYRDD
jgi:hypothetical protein